jgi:hypothetical protein
MRAPVIIVAMVFVWALPSQAAAQSCEAPPGTSAVDEYCETVPTARGERGAGDRPERPVAIPAGTARELAETEEGVALLQKLGGDPDNPSASEPVGNASKPPVNPGGDFAPKDASFDGFATVRELISAGPRLGGGFTFALFAAVVLMFGWAWVEFRRRPNAG